MAENKERETKRERGRGRKVFWIVVVVAGLLTMVHYGLGSMRHHHHGRHTVHSPSDVKGRMVRKAERALKEVNATLEQREKRERNSKSGSSRLSKEGIHRPMLSNRHEHQA
jgi:hypothetical protein